jgi:tetratricopeptide (TPR) repeat protein
MLFPGGKSMRAQICWGTVGLLLWGCACPLWGETSAETPAGDLAARADAQYEKRADPSAAALAVELYQKAAAADPANYAVWWRLARACWWLGDHVPKAERLAIYDQGKTAGEKAVQLQPQGRDGHYWLGVCMGRTGEERGVLNSLFLVAPIAKEMEAVLAIQPRDAEARHVLSILYRKAPGWPLSRGDMQKSLALAREAVAIRPDLVNNHVGLALTLLALHQDEEAKQELHLALTLPGAPEYQPETVDDKHEAQTLLNPLP